MFKVNLLGRLGRNAGLFETANGGKFVAFTVAVNTKNLGKDITYWVDVRSFNPNHIKIMSYLTKGKLIQIGGDYNAMITTDKAGVARISHNINADYINFINLGSSNKNDDGTTTSTITNDDIKSEVSVNVNKTTEETIVMNTPPVQEMVPVTVGAATTTSDDLPF